MKFQEYPIAPELKRSLAEQDLKRPTDIQFKAIPNILKGEDVLAIAQTGTGKTAAFAIPVLNLLHNKKRSKRTDGIRCVVMAPTRELAQQIDGVFRALGKYTKVQTYCVTGGVDQDPQIIKLQKGIDVLIATPGRVFDLVSQRKLFLNKVEILVLDEADHMLDRGFLKDIQDLIRFLPKNRQTLFFSATIDETIKKLAYSLVRNAIRIQISPKNPIAKNIEHAVTFVEMDDKRFFLERLLHENPLKKILVFVRTQVRAERVEKALARMKLESQSLHGGKEQAERRDTLKDFRNDEVSVLIATDVTARGIDIPDIDMVVNYDLPEHPEVYVHRIGRTGRGNKKGKAISFCAPPEEEFLQKIEEYITEPVERINVSKKDYKETVETTTDTPDDWKALIKQHDKEIKTGKRRKKK
jgi:ATP-dependent RNA helicase RhlE